MRTFRTKPNKTVERFKKLAKLSFEPGQLNEEVRNLRLRTKLLRNTRERPRISKSL